MHIHEFVSYFTELLSTIIFLGPFLLVLNKHLNPRNLFQVPTGSCVQLGRKLSLCSSVQHGRKLSLCSCACPYSALRSSPCPFGTRGATNLATESNTNDGKKNILQTHRDQQCDRKMKKRMRFTQLCQN